jgi:hypothetical protein
MENQDDEFSLPDFPIDPPEETVPEEIVPEETVTPNRKTKKRKKRSKIPLSPHKRRLSFLRSPSKRRKPKFFSV